MDKKKKTREDAAGSYISVGDVSNSSGVAIGSGARATIVQGAQVADIVKLIAPLLKAVQETELSPEKKQETLAEAKSVEEELSKLEPNGRLLNDRLMKLATLGGSIATAAMKLAQTPVIQMLIQKALG